MLLSKTETGESLISFFYIFFQFIFNFLYLFSLSFSFLFVILLNILPANNLLFRDILIQLNIFKVNNIFFILIPAVYIYL